MSMSTRLFKSALLAWINDMVVASKFTKAEILVEIRNLRSYGRCHARNEILRHFGGQC